MSRLHDGRPHMGGVCPQSSQIPPSGTDEGAGREVKGARGEGQEEGQSGPLLCLERREMYLPAVPL